MLLGVILFAVITAVSAQMYDMIDGNDEGLVFPCSGGPIGYWTQEEASKYPGGPTDGFVLTSSEYESSCLDTPTPVHVTRNSKLYIAVRVPYKVASDEFKVWIVRNTSWVEWFSVSGPVPPEEHWMQEEVPLPNIVAEGDYVIRLWDMSASFNVSLRYFEITDYTHATTSFPGGGGTGTPPPSTTTPWITTSRGTDTTTSGMSTTPTPAPTTTKPPPTGTTERITTMKPTTERITTVERTTERITTPIRTTQRITTLAP